MPFNIDSQNIYCFAIGKPFARIDDFDFAFALDGIEGSREEALDDLTTRSLLTMRPSPFWSSVTPASIEFARKERPRELLAYLMNRMYAPIEHSQSRPITVESKLQAMRFRCHIWHIIESTIFVGEQLEQLLFVLLELDSRFNLAKLAKPTSVASAWSESNVGRLLETLAQWRDTLVEKQRKEERLARASDAFWARGSKLTRKAFSASFMETKPLTRPLSPKAAAKKKDSDLFSSILAEMFPDEAAIGLQPSVATQPAPHKVQSMLAAQAESRTLNVIRPLGGKIRFGVK